MHSEHPHIGKGLAFPMHVNAKGEIALSDGVKDIEQSIFIILGTQPGERVMRPEFGCRAHELLFEPRDAATLSLLEKYIVDALEFWEPRIDVVAVSPSIEDGNDGAVFVEIDYVIRTTHDTRSIVYPFFLTDQESW